MGDVLLAVSPQLARCRIKSTHYMLKDSECVSDRGLSEPCMATLVGNQRVTAADHFQDTRHLCFDLGATGPHYDPGDVLSIFPRQDESAVGELLAMFGLQPSQRVRIELAEASNGGPPASMEVSPARRLSLVGACCLHHQRWCFVSDALRTADSISQHCHRCVHR